MIRRVQYLLDGRLFEWTFSLGTFWLAVETLTWPDSIMSGAFKRLTDYMSPELVSVYALVVSIVGMVALTTNGYSTVWGPCFRAVCASARGYLWGQMGYALFLIGQTQPTPSIGFGFWVLFTFAELYVTFRAMSDVQRAV